MVNPEFDIVTQLNDLSLSQTSAVLLRHAKRDPIVSTDTVWSAGLTPEGRADAVNLGQSFKPFSLGGAFASPIPRCQDTAALILSGWGHENPAVTEDRFLLNAFVANRERVKAQFEVNNAERLILEQVNGKTREGFHSNEVGAMRLLRFMMQRMVPGALTIFVTHDALLMPFCAHFLQSEFSMDNWFPCLGGVVVTSRNDGIYVNGVRGTGPIGQ